MDMRFQAVGLPAEPETVFHSFLFLYLFLYLTLFDKTSSSIVEWTRTVANRSQEDSQVIEGYRIFSTSSKTRSPKLGSDGGGGGGGGGGDGGGDDDSVGVAAALKEGE
ncbi:hypothetical protein HZH68_008307 [Vespula germanica]|uniref:Uncharacterized protein n=1 Tax=Vespula germanica TaxID=30212 RepID=A0A834K4I2_VESGE|nr:hypothetical protein HZH68_008307 [Vespula germanica]